MKQSRKSRASRRTGPQRRRRVIRVLTEGKVTEPSYLAIWARSNRDKVRINFGPTGMAPLQMVEKAYDYERANRRSRSGSPNPDFDEIWCVFDVDQHANVPQALNKARQNGIRVALSNPCFELWLVLHFEDQTAHIEARDVQERAKQLGILDGKQLHESNVDALLNGYDDARQRATKLNERHKGNDSPCWENPSTSVWKLIDLLR